MASSKILLVFTCICIFGSNAIFTNIVNKRDIVDVFKVAGIVGNVSANQFTQLIRMKICPNMAWQSGINCDFFIKGFEKIISHNSTINIKREVEERFHISRLNVKILQTFFFYLEVKAMKIDLYYIRMDVLGYIVQKVTLTEQKSLFSKTRKNDRKNGR